MARGLRLTWTSSNYVFGRHDGIRLRIEASDACEMTDKIFAYRMLPTNPQTGEKAGFFSHICSPVDLEDYPADEPLAAHKPEWFRLSYADVLLRSVDEAENLRLAVIEDVRRLKLTLDTMGALFPGAVVDVGDICPEEVVSSVSSVSSESSPSPGSLDSVGPAQTLTVAGTSEQNLGSVGVDWTPVSTGAGSALGDSSYQQVLLQPGFSSKLLLIQGYDFATLPDDADIVGISVNLRLRWVEHDVDFDFCPQLSFVALHHPEQGAIANEGTDVCVPGPAFSSVALGGAADLWDKTWSHALLQRGEFGVGLVVTLPSEAAAEMELATVQIDGAEITVHYASTSVVIETTNDGYVGNDVGVKASELTLVITRFTSNPVGNNLNHVWIGFPTGLASGTPVLAALLRVFPKPPYLDPENGGVTGGEFTTLRVRAFDEDNPATPVSYVDYLTRVKTAAETIFHPDPPYIEGAYWEIDVTAIVQAVVNRPTFSGFLMLTVEETGALISDYTFLAARELGPAAQLRMAIGQP